jgi:tetraacyldisaccharide 4'-kinase
VTPIPRALQILLWPLSVVYGCVVRGKNWMYDTGWLRAKRLKGTVISVGNLTTGGTGKTPMVLWLAQKFLAEGKSVAILSRGYKGSRGTSDEIELLRRRLGDGVRFGVGPDRYASGVQLEAERGVDVFLLDDGFQHRQLARDLDILMIDGSRDLNDEWMLPSGSLREPVSTSRRADILVVSRNSEKVPLGKADLKRQPVFYAQTRLVGFRRLGAEAGPSDYKYASTISSAPSFAFCGIGNPDAFFADLVSWRVELVGEKTFRDHHAYSELDVEQLEAEADKFAAADFVTTEKDAENLTERHFRRPVWVTVIDFVPSAESEFVAAIERVLRERRGAAA